MPIPAPELYRPSNLTKKQREEAIAACYGVTVNAAEQFRPDEIERMRQIIAQVDGNNHKPMQTLDLNNPPRVPYRFQKFPMMVYDLERSTPAHEEERVNRSGFVEWVQVGAHVVTLLVQNEDQLQTALAEGWSEQAPGFSESPTIELSPALQREAEVTQERVENARRSPRGRRDVA